jgi:type VI secretion system secreted protein Hcp
MAQPDFLLDIQSIKGETKDHEIPQGIEIKGFSYSMVSPSDPVSHRGTGAVRVADISVRKQVDASSPALLAACMRNQKLNQAVLTCRKAGGEQEPYFEILMEDARIRSVTARADGGPIVEEIVAIGFSKITWTYAEQSKEGRLVGGRSTTYSIASNTG